MKHTDRLVKRIGAAALAVVLAMSGAMGQQVSVVYATYGDLSSYNNGLIADHENSELISDHGESGLIADPESDDGLIPESYPDDVIVPRKEDNDENEVTIYPGQEIEPSYDGSLDPYYYQENDQNDQSNEDTVETATET